MRFYIPILLFDECLHPPISLPAFREGNRGMYHAKSASLIGIFGYDHRFSQRDNLMLAYPFGDTG
jgi:hypothetical protein